jgi:predicted amidohydrolase YtcJ
VLTPPAAADSVPGAMAEPADLILADADVWCGGAIRRWANAVAIGGDRIIAAGTEDQVREHRGPGTEVLSLPGRMIVPAFQDAHAHPAFGARNLLELNLDDLYGRDAYLERIGAYAAEHPELEWITGGGWSIGAFPGGTPRREDLDAVVGDRPAFLMDTDVHGAWVSSRGLALAGVTAATPDPWDGRIERDENGEPAGTLTEGAAYTFRAHHVPATSPARLRECLRVGQRELHALGIAGWQDAWVEPDLLRAYRDLDDAGELTMRVVASLWWDRHLGPEQVDALVEQRAWGTGGRVDAGTVKIMLDGCPENGTGGMLEPYHGPHAAEDGRGILFVEGDALREAVTRLDALGFQVHFHALGDRAFREALDAVEAAQAANGPRNARHHVAHLQIVDPVDRPRLRRLGVVANMQPYWAQRDDDLAALSVPRVGQGRFGRFYEIASVLRSGAVLAFGSDWPVSTPDPLAEIDVAVNRRPVGEPDVPPFNPEERIGLPDALAAFTRGAAYVNRDDDAGSIAPGLRADLAVLDRNVFDRARGEIAEARVEMTFAAGRAVHGA